MFACGGLLDLFSKKTTQTSTTTNTDNSRTTTLSDSLNSWVSNNLALTKADSRVYNSAFDATDSFNKVNTFNILGAGNPAPALDFVGLRSLFTQPDDVITSLNANDISKDPNANKYDWSFDQTSGGGNAFLQQVAGLVKNQWEGFADTTKANQPASALSLPVIFAVVIIGIIVLYKIFKR